MSVGGFHPNNQDTSWPNLHAHDKQDFNSSWNCMLGPSVAKMKKETSYSIFKKAYLAIEVSEDSDSENLINSLLWENLADTEC